jgi:hypothetical protein
VLLPGHRRAGLCASAWNPAGNPDHCFHRYSPCRVDLDPHIHGHADGDSTTHSERHCYGLAFPHSICTPHPDSNGSSEPNTSTFPHGDSNLDSAADPNFKPIADSNGRAATKRYSNILKRGSCLRLVLIPTPETRRLKAPLW